MIRSCHQCGQTLTVASIYGGQHEIGPGVAGYRTDIIRTNQDGTEVVVRYPLCFTCA
jgi:hypothetical protein